MNISIERTQARPMGQLGRSANQSASQSAKLLLCAVALVGIFHSNSIYAAGEVSFIETADEPATPLRYEIDGTTYTWGMGTNQVMEGFTTDGRSYDYFTSADRVEIVRNDVVGVSSGIPCGVFVERFGAASDVLQANYPSDGTDTGNCDMAAMLASRVVNRGALNLFSNIGPNPKNVERVDYLFDRGLVSPLAATALPLSGHVVAEKSGNNPIQIAAITEIDVFGQPAAYGPLVLVGRNGECADGSICYGITNLRHNYTFFQNDSEAPQGFPSFLKDSTESVGMAFVSLEELGLSAGELYYGFSYFGDDVDASIHTLTDVSTFPQDTDDEQILFGDGPDIYGGVSGYFLQDDVNVITGAVFKDEDGDGQISNDEAGISDIGLELFTDSNGNGVFDAADDAQVGPAFSSDVNGEFVLPGLDDGIFFLQLDESDEDLPPALSVAPGTNPIMIVVQGGDADGINFSFVSDTGPSDDASGDDATGDDATGDDGAGNASTGGGAGDTDGAGSGVTDAGGTDAGGTGAGGTGAGGADADAGDADANGSDAGSTDAGDTGAGGTDAGGTGEGGTDAGGPDAGGTDAGGPDEGATDVDGNGSGSVDNGTGDNFVSNGDGDDETAANPDSATVEQGSTATIDVLANDDDASGQGLTIVSTSESPNATIEISNGVILYTPNFGFIGMDTFLYVVEDGAGTQSTGTVDVNVQRFSDINDNGTNDFTECNCDNLQIEVGVDGSALGASSILGFGILSLLLGFRRLLATRRKVNCGVCK